MADKIRAQVVGGQVKDFDGVGTVQDLANAMQLEGNYKATVNGEPAEFTDSLSNYAYVTFAEKVKGGMLQLELF